MKTKDFQNCLTEKLEKYFPQAVKKEWSIAKEATDTFNDSKCYAPRLDIAVGPFNVNPCNLEDKIRKKFKKEAPNRLQEYVGKLCPNDNPRCALAIEISFSGSSKHILGDITNASMMGLYGFVITSESTDDKVRRIFKYTEKLKDVGKASERLFSNVCVIRDFEFENLLR